MKDPLITALQSLTLAMQSMAAEQRETNLLIRELLELEAEGDTLDAADAQPQGMGTSTGSIVRRS